MYIMHTILGGWGSVVGIVLHYGLDSPRFHRGGGEVLCTGPDWPCGLLSFLYSGTGSSFPGEKWPLQCVDCPHFYLC